MHSGYIQAQELGQTGRREGRRRKAETWVPVFTRQASALQTAPRAPELRRWRGGGVLSAGYARGHCSHRALGTGQPRRPRWRHGFSREGNRGASTPGDGLGCPTRGHAAPLQVARLSLLHFFPRESQHTGVTKYGLGAKPFCDRKRRQPSI